MSGVSPADELKLKLKLMGDQEYYGSTQLQGSKEPSDVLYLVGDLSCAKTRMV